MVIDHEQAARIHKCLQGVPPEARYSHFTDLLSDFCNENNIHSNEVNTYVVDKFLNQLERDSNV